MEEKPQKQAKKQPIFIENGLLSGTPEGTRTPDLLVRSQSLYPTELPAHTTLKALQYNSTVVLKMQVFFSKIAKFFSQGVPP